MYRQCEARQKVKPGVEVSRNVTVFYLCYYFVIEMYSYVIFIWQYVFFDSVQLNRFGFFFRFFPKRKCLAMKLTTLIELARRTQKMMM